MILQRSWQHRRLSAEDALLLLWLVVPVLRVSVPRATDFDGIRHWLEFVPAAALIAGIGGSALLRQGERLLRVVGDAGATRKALWRARRFWGVVLVVAWLSPVIHWNITRHPHQLVFFNSLIGGLRGAQAYDLRESTDYWGLSYRQTAGWFNANAGSNALVLVALAPHVAEVTRGHWLRRDIDLRSTGDRIGPLLTTIGDHPGEVYLMYITRRRHHTDLIRRCEELYTPAYEIRVDGGALVKVHRLK
jgi:hypothetical protein